MNMTYDEYKQLARFFNNEVLDYVKEEEGCVFTSFNDFLEEWYNVKDEYKNVDAYLKDVEISGVDSLV